MLKPKFDKINTMKKTKSISDFDFATLYATILPNFIKILSSNQKLEVPLLFQIINLLDIKRLWKKMLHRTNFDWCYLIFNHKMFYHWKPSIQTRDWHSHRHRPSSITVKPLPAFFESKYPNPNKIKITNPNKDNKYLLRY